MSLRLSSIRGRVVVATMAGLGAGLLALGVALSNLTEARAALIVGGTAACVAGVGVAIVMSRRITSPIERMTAQAERLASGDREELVAEGPDELKALAVRLQRMAEAIQAARAAAEDERDRLAMLLDELAEAVLIADARGAVVDANRAFRRIFGADPNGRRVVEVVRDHELLEAIDTVRVGHDAIAEIERTDPRVSLRAIVRRLEDGELVLVVQDLTDVRRLETVRRDFVANISHELRTPIASLKAMAETLEAGALDDRVAARDFISRMHAEIEDLAQLVEELLTLSRLESAELELRRQRIAAAELVRRACERMTPLADRAGLALTSELMDGGREVYADPERIGQVFSNLIHNAVKYTPRGGKIRVATESVDGAVAFSVADTGQGISATELSRIFERFYKGDRARASTGTGLGLAIAKHIVQAHGGTITAMSEGPGRGATFTFTLPT